MNEKHGAYKRHKRLYTVWTTMIHRCYDEKRSNYKRYGGRGIEICEEWKEDPNNFIYWALENGYERGLQLDRINNDGNYCPSNCRFVTPKQNSRNTRRNKSITLLGQRKTVAEWCDVIPISQYTMYWWIREYGEKGCESRVYKRLSEIE